VVGEDTMPMKNPPHPGRSICSACLEPLGLTVTAGASVLGVTRQALNNVLDVTRRNSFGVLLKQPVVHRRGG